MPVEQGSEDEDNVTSSRGKQMKSAGKRGELRRIKQKYWRLFDIWSHRYAGGNDLPKSVSIRFECLFKIKSYNFHYSITGTNGGL